MPAPESARRPNETFDSMTEAQRVIYHSELAKRHARRAVIAALVAMSCSFVAFVIAAVAVLAELR